MIKKKHEGWGYKVGPTGVVVKKRAPPSCGGAGKLVEISSFLLISNNYGKTNLVKFGRKSNDYEYKSRVIGYFSVTILYVHTCMFGNYGLSLTVLVWVVQDEKDDLTLFF